MLAALFFLSQMVGGAAAEPSPGPLHPIPFVAALEHAQGIQVRGATGATRVLHKGDSFRKGDTFLTGPNASVWVDYANGVHLLVGKDTQVTLGAAEAADRDAPSIDVKEGDVRVLIDHHGPARDEWDNRPEEPVRFLVKTPQSWMGAHGTDFLVSVFEDETRLHTVHGAVSVAASVAGVFEKKVLTTEAGEFTQAFLGKRGINKVRDFNAAEYVAKFHGRQPTLELLYTTVAKSTAKR